MMKQLRWVIYTLNPSRINPECLPLRSKVANDESSNENDPPTKKIEDAPQPKSESRSTINSQKLLTAEPQGIIPEARMRSSSEYKRQFFVDPKVVRLKQAEVTVGPSSWSSNLLILNLFFPECQRNVFLGRRDNQRGVRRMSPCVAKQLSTVQLMTLKLMDCWISVLKAARLQNKHQTASPKIGKWKFINFTIVTHAASFRNTHNNFTINPIRMKFCIANESPTPVSFN